VKWLRWLVFIAGCTTTLTWLVAQFVPFTFGMGRFFYCYAFDSVIMIDVSQLRNSGKRDFYIRSIDQVEQAFYRRAQMDRGLSFGFRHYEFPAGQSTYFIAHWLAILVPWLFFVVVWRWKKRKPKGHCQSCGYDLTGNTTGVCPECNTAVRSNSLTINE